MNYKELTAPELIAQLNVAGEHPHPDLIDAVWEKRSETEPLLLDLFAEAYDDDWSSDDDPRWYRFVHAGKFLLAWQNLDALPVFARLYRDSRTMSNWCEWFEEDLYHFGPAAIPYLKSVIDKVDTVGWHYGKALSGSILTKIATYYPETREAVIPILRAQLPPVDTPPDEVDEMWDGWASELGELSDETSRDRILALFANEEIEIAFMNEEEYRRLMNRGFQPQKPPEPYDIRADYRTSYADHVRRQKQIARQEAKTRRVRSAQPRTGPKVGRNDPCPCGSGRKYKRCHGRPGT